MVFQLCKQLGDIDCFLEISILLQVIKSQKAFHGTCPFVTSILQGVCCQKWIDEVMKSCDMITRGSLETFKQLLSQILLSLAERKGVPTVMSINGHQCCLSKALQWATIASQAIVIHDGFPKSIFETQPGIKIGSSILMVMQKKDTSLPGAFHQQALYSKGGL